MIINCGVALNGDSEFLQGSHETNGLTVKGLVGHQSAKRGASEGKKGCLGVIWKEPADLIIWLLAPYSGS